MYEYYPYFAILIYLIGSWSTFFGSCGVIFVCTVVMEPLLAKLSTRSSKAFLLSNGKIAFQQSICIRYTKHIKFNQFKNRWIGLK